MKKKMVGCLLVMTMLCSLAVGCGSQKDAAKTADISKEETPESDVSENEENMHLTLGMAGTDIKATCVILASQLGYYEEEGVDVDFEKISNLADALTAVSEDKLDVLPFGVIPSCSYISQGVDVVMIGGTISEGSEAIVTKENAKHFRSLEDFEGAKIGCFRMETGHMVMRGLLREAGFDVNKDMEFIYLDSQSSILEAVEKGEVDIGFVNSGYGYVAQQAGVEVAFQVGDYKEGFPCCRQTTSRNCIDTKRDALLAYEIANLRAYKVYMEDKETTVKELMEYCGQDEDYVSNVLYGSDTYDNAMIVSLDPNKNRVSEFYDVMKANGDIDASTTYDVNDNIDITIYGDALKTMMEREPDSEIYQTLYEEYEKNNL